MRDCLAAAVFTALSAAEEEEKFLKAKELGNIVLETLLEKAEHEQTETVILAMYLSIISLTEAVGGGSKDENSEQ